MKKFEFFVHYDPRLDMLTVGITGTDFLIYASNNQQFLIDRLHELYLKICTITERPIFKDKYIFFDNLNSNEVSETSKEYLFFSLSHTTMKQNHFELIEPLLSELAINLYIKQKELKKYNNLLTAIAKN